MRVALSAVSGDQRHSEHAGTEGLVPRQRDRRLEHLDAEEVGDDEERNPQP